MPVNPTVWVVPGLLGSHLYTRLPRGIQRARHIWYNVGSIAACLTELLRGTTRGDIVPRGVLDNLEPLLHHLQRTRPVGVDVFPYSWDWRQGVVEEGATLADLLEQTAEGAAGSQYLACHSLGGMLARVAWRKLVERGKGFIVKRIVTIGTPHRGSYATAQTWCEQNSSMNSFAVAKRGPFNIPLPHFLALQEGINVGAYSLFASWTAPYETLPIPDAQGVEVDPLRPTVYDATTWAASYASPPQSLLDLARNEWWPYIAAPASMPPADVLRCVAGRGMQTAQRLVAPSFFNGRALHGNPLRGLGLILRANRLGRLPSFLVDEEGDGSVPIGSAIIPGREALVVLGEHSALPSHPAILERIWGLLFDAPLPEPPPPVVVTDPGYHPQFTPPDLGQPSVRFRPCCHNRESAPC